MNMARRDVLTTLRQGKKIVTPFLVVYARQNPANTPGRFACVVSKKVARLSVRRHHYQRWMREVVRSLEPRLVSRFNLVCILRPAFVQLKSWRDLQEKIKPVLEHWLISLSRTNIVL